MNNLDKHKFIINVAVIIMDGRDNRVLVIKRSMKEDKNPGKYGIPGGKMDHTDADFFAAGAREVFEEVGLNIHPEEIYEQHKNETGDKIYITLWKRNYSINRKEIAFDANEVESVHWFNFDELLEMNADDFTPNTHKLLLKFLRRRDS